MAKFSFTLVLYVSLVLALNASASTNTLDSHRRDHANLNRLIKKRSPAPQGGLGNIFGGGNNQPTPQAASSTPAAAPTSATGETTPTVSAPANSVSNAASSPAAASPSTSGGGLLGSVVGGLLPTGSSSTASSSAAPTGSSSTASQSQASSTSSPTSQAAPTPAPSQQQGSTSYLYVTTSATPSPSQTSTTSSSSGITHTAMTVLIVIAASIGASIIIWTIIRKWKFRPSSDFDSRMNPIDWQPGADDDTGLPGQRRRLSNASSFHSGSNHGDAHSQAGGYGAPALNPIPDHDFTAGPANLAPVGGYADLARGPSPQPMMQELGRGPSLNTHYGYDQPQYGVPLHHGYNAHGY